MFLSSVRVRVCVCVCVCVSFENDKQDLVVAQISCCCGSFVKCGLFR